MRVQSFQESLNKSGKSGKSRKFEGGAFPQEFVAFREKSLLFHKERHAVAGASTPSPTTASWTSGHFRLVSGVDASSKHYCPGDTYYQPFKGVCESLYAKFTINSTILVISRDVL